MVPEHIAEVRSRRLTWIDKTRAAVKDRLTKEITYWDHRAEQLKFQEQAGKAGARLNSQEARRRADELQARLQRRLAELDREAQISALPPVVLGGIGATYALGSTLPALDTMTPVLVVGMACLGLGNGAVFQLVPRRFSAEIGVATGVVGAIGGLGGFLLPIMFGAILDRLGVNSSCFMLLYGIVAVS